MTTASPVSFSFKTLPQPLQDKSLHVKLSELKSGDGFAVDLHLPD